MVRSADWKPATPVLKGRCYITHLSYERIKTYLSLTNSSFVSVNIISEKFSLVNKLKQCLQGLDKTNLLLLSIRILTIVSPAQSSTQIGPLVVGRDLTGNFQLGLRHTLLSQSIRWMNRTSLRGYLPKMLIRHLTRPRVTPDKSYYPAT